MVLENFNGFSLSAILILLLFSIIMIYHQIWRSSRHVKLGNQIPGPPCWQLPILGNAHFALKLILEAPSAEGIMKTFVYWMDKLNSSVVRMWIGQRLVVLISDPQDIELVLGGYTHLTKSPEYNLFQPWLGEGLLISKGEKWSSHRKMIAPTFHTSILKTFIPIFNLNAQKLIKNLNSEMGKVFDIHDYMGTTTVDILLESAMGVKNTKKGETGHSYAAAVMKLCNIMHLRHMKFWLKPDFIFQLTSMAKEQTRLYGIVHSLTDKVVKYKQETYDEKSTTFNKAFTYSKSQLMNSDIQETFKDDIDLIDENDVGEKKRLAFLDYMIGVSKIEGINLTDNEIREEVDTIMFEGHDTTAAASSFVLCLLGAHQNIQETVFEEMKEIFQDNMDRPITYNDVLQMKNLEKVILETLRLYPPVPVISRTVEEDVQCVSKDCIIPKGTTVVVSPFITHRDPKYYKDPLKFNPDNFEAEKCSQRNYYSFIPFSAGPRSCVGRKYALLKIKILLAAVIRKFKIFSAVPEEEFRLQSDIILKRADGFNITIETR